MDGAARGGDSERSPAGAGVNPVPRFDYPDAELVEVNAAALPYKGPRPRCGILGCDAPATHVYRSLSAGLGAWVCVDHAIRINESRSA